MNWAASKVSMLMFKDGSHAFHQWVLVIASEPLARLLKPHFNGMFFLFGDLCGLLVKR